MGDSGGTLQIKSRYTSSSDFQRLTIGAANVKQRGLIPLLELDRME
jgi:hypothetical protein